MINHLALVPDARPYYLIYHLIYRSSPHTSNLHHLPCAPLLVTLVIKGSQTPPASNCPIPNGTSTSVYLSCFLQSRTKLFANGNGFKKTRVVLGSKLDSINVPPAWVWIIAKTAFVASELFLVMCTAAPRRHLFPTLVLQLCPSTAFWNRLLSTLVLRWENLAGRCVSSTSPQ